MNEALWGDPKEGNTSQTFVLLTNLKNTETEGPLGQKIVKHLQQRYIGQSPQTSPDLARSKE